jgi:hypothetical protein
MKTRLLIVLAGTLALSISTPARSSGASAMPYPVSRPQILVDAAKIGAPISKDVLGANMAAWFDQTHPGVAAALQGSGLHLTRWPGGSLSDAYHWQTATACGGGYINPNSTFDNFMQDVAIPAHLDVAVTVNYGSNAACNAGGDPAEAAAWVDYANNTKHYGIKRWTVGNENYGFWEYDLHPLKNDAGTYAAAVATGFYPAIKTKDPTSQVGIVVAGSYSPAWDSYVLTHAKFDFVEAHYYAQSPGSESDSYLLIKAPAAVAAEIAKIRGEMNAAGVPKSVPIYEGELNSVVGDPGKQAMSIVNGLFAGMATAELMKQGVPMMTWWLGFGGCGVGNQSKSLYGWQNFGGYMMLSDGTPEYGCSNAQTTAFGTPFPDARAFQVLANFAQPGNHLVTVDVDPSRPLVRSYAATAGTGFALLLFNLDKNVRVPVNVTLDHTARTSFTASSIVYDKALYDQSKHGAWPGPVTSSLGTVGKTFSLTLTPWSMTVVQLL